MGFTEDVSIKYGAFTLGYSTLLAHLADLDRALGRDNQDLMQGIIAQVDGALQEQVYYSRPRDLNQAVGILLARLGGERMRIETMKPDAAKIIEEIMADIEKGASNWQYEAEVERHREWGEKLSRLFYEGTPWTRTQERLTTGTNVLFRYAGVLNPEIQGRNTYGYRVALMAFYSKYDGATDDEPEDNVILVRFSFGHSFSTYLAYPFFFLHEYASHVHGANSDSDIFDDGWMMYAIHEFLINRNDSLPSMYRLQRAQIQAIDDHCPGKISTQYLRDHYLLGRNIHKWSSPWAQEFFRQLTWELAGYPLSNENPYFIASFIERLCYQFDQSREDLKRKIESYTSVDDLFMQLPPP